MRCSPVRALSRSLALAAASCAALAPVAAGAQVFVEAPDFSGAPVTGAEPGIVLPIPGATDAEYSAALLWTLRAGLNVAALQCQQMPMVNAVENYNALLSDHSDEMRPAYVALQNYFKRTQGASGAKAFDVYNTRTYNGFSSLYALAGFCHAAGEIGRDVLFAPRGGMLAVARDHMQEFRNSLIPARDRFWITAPLYVPAPSIPDFDPKCYDKKGQVKAKCLKD